MLPTHSTTRRPRGAYLDGATKEYAERVARDNTRDAAIRRCTAMKFAHCRPGEPPTVFNSKTTTMQELQQNGQGLIEVYGLLTYRGWLHPIHPVRRSVARGSQDDEAMALDGWGTVVPPRRGDHGGRNIIYEGTIVGDKKKTFQIWVDPVGCG